jgi:hypothetical protein
MVFEMLYGRMESQGFADDAIEECAIRHILDVEIGLGGCKGFDVFVKLRLCFWMLAELVGYPR